MKFRIALIITLASVGIGCANQKTKEGRQLKVTREENVLSCRNIGTVSGDDAMERAASLDRATHLVWTAKNEAKVYSCD